MLNECVFRVFFLLLRALLFLRYRFEFKGIERLKEEMQNTKKGSLFLSNHVSLLDALILNAFLWPKFRIRSMGSTYRFPFIGKFLKHSQAVLIPDLEYSVNQAKIQNVHHALETVDQGLKAGGRFLLFPSGRLKRSANESLKRSSAAHSLTLNNPEINIILIRLNGLWGSRFSSSLTGQTPNFFHEILRGFKIVLKNLIFFCPRRKITIELLINPPELPKNANRQEFNRYLESWYNRYPNNEEPLTLVSYSFWKNEFPKIANLKREEISKEFFISDEDRLKIVRELQRILENPKLEISPNANLAFDLGMDSLNLADLSSYLLRNYEIETFQTEHLNTVQDVFDLVGGKKVATPSPNLPPSKRWPQEAKRPDPISPLGETIPEAFLRICEKMDGFTVCGDDVVGAISYRKMKLSILALAEIFRKMPEPNIAVMMPATVIGFITILAIQFAGKIPVMLNWTLGSRYLEEMMKGSGAQRLITSERFLDRLSHVEFGNIVSQMEFLENIKTKISIRIKLRSWFLSQLSSMVLIKKLNLQKLDSKSTCVIVFTSGTESTPKGVPLSHQNILANTKDFIHALGLCGSDSLLAIVPPFHAMGLVGTGFVPLLSGLKTAFFPDPTNSEMVADSIHRWKSTILVAPSSFLKKIGDVATNQQLETVRIFGTGGERLSPDIAQRISYLGNGAIIVEAYGMSECGGVVTVQNPGLAAKGVGQILPSYEFCTIHPETLKCLPTHQEGEICLRGPCVFNGYLNESHSPFIEVDGEKWYRTGDIGKIDNDRNIYFLGRLKRFTKISGEMISLGAIETALIQRLTNEGKISTNTHPLVISADERIAGKPRLILFTILQIEKEEANKILQQEGFSNLIKIFLVKKVDEIPILSTGKIDYKKLKSDYIDTPYPYQSMRDPHSN